MKNRKSIPKTEPGTILLVLSDEHRHYYHSLIYIPVGSTDSRPMEYTWHTRAGMVQDSVIIYIDDLVYTEHSIEIRYHPHDKHITIYMAETDGQPLYVANVGNTLLSVDICERDYDITPRKQVRIM